MAMVLMTGGSLLLILSLCNLAGASRLDDLLALEEPVSYEQFLEAITAHERAEETRVCEEAQGKGDICRTTPEDIIRQKAKQAFDAHVDRLEEQAFRRQQEEDDRDRAQRKARIQALFQRQYEEKIAASGNDPSVIQLPIGTTLCNYPNSPQRATITEITTHGTARLRLHVRTRRGDVEGGSGEVIVRQHPDGPHAYEIEILTIVNELGLVDFASLGMTKAVAPCADELHPPHTS